MTHLDPDRLADRALGDDDPLTAAEEKHLNSCAECRDELAQLSRIAELSRHPEQLAQVPADAIWRSIQGQLASQTPAPSNRGCCRAATFAADSQRTATPNSETASMAFGGGRRGDRTHHRRRRHDRRRPRPSRGHLEHCAGGTAGTDGQGTAELVRDQAGPELRVQIDAPPAGSLQRSVADQHRRPTHVSLRVLPDDGRATYPLPPAWQGNSELHHRRRIDRTLRWQSALPRKARSAEPFPPGQPALKSIADYEHCAREGPTPTPNSYSYPA